MKDLSDSARKAREEKRQNYHGTIHADSLTPPDIVKSSKQMSQNKQITDFSKNLFKTPPAFYNTSCFRTPFTIPTVTSPMRMPQTLIPPLTTSSSLTVVNKPVTAYSTADATLATGTTSRVHTATSSISNTTSSPTTTATSNDSGQVTSATSSTNLQNLGIFINKQRGTEGIRLSRPMFVEKAMLREKNNDETLSLERRSLTENEEFYIRVFEMLRRGTPYANAHLFEQIRFSFELISKENCLKRKCYYNKM